MYANKGQEINKSPIVITNRILMISAVIADSLVKFKKNDLKVTVRILSMIFDCY